MRFSIHYAIISHNRPENVVKMEKITGISEKLNWYVGKGEKKAYKHAKGTVVEGGTLCESRNRALIIANACTAHCLMMDDDLEWINYFTENGEKTIPFKVMVSTMKEILESSPLYLVGTASTINRFFYHPDKPLGLKHFIGGWCTMTKYQADPRYDEKLKTKEDYDITLQHIKQYGGAIRINFLAPHFKHYNNKGGVVDIRTPKIEQQSIAILKKKWGATIQDNPRRPNEILLRIK